MSVQACSHLAHTPSTLMSNYPTYCGKPTCWSWHSTVHLYCKSGLLAWLVFVGCFLSFFSISSAAFNDSVLWVLDCRVFIGSKKVELTQKFQRQLQLTWFKVLVDMHSKRYSKKTWHDQQELGIPSSSAQNGEIHRKSFDGNKTKLNPSLSHYVGKRIHNLQVRRECILK